MEILVGIIFLIFGLSSIVGGILFFRSAYHKAHTWQTVSGTVIGYKQYDYSVSRTSYLPQVQFVSVDGQTHTFYSSTGSGRRPYHIGGAVKVIYPLDNPAKATIKSVSNLCALPIFALFIGVVFTLLGLDGIFVK
jgi:hypothetical protein